MKYLFFAALILWAKISSPALAEGDCTDFFKDEQGQGYQFTCEEKEGGREGRVFNKTMTAFARDNSHFIFLYRATAGLRTYIEHNDSISRVADRLLSGHGETKAGKNLGPIETLETKARLNGADNNCLVFQRLGRREYSGYIRVNLGMICTKGDISLAYGALERLSLYS